MKSDPGASYECPLVLEDSSPQQRQNVVCLDDSNDDNRKMPAKVARADDGASSPQSQRRRRPFSSLAAAAARFESDSDDDRDTMLARKLQQEEWGSRRRGKNKSNHHSDPTLDYLLMAEREGKDDDLELLAMESDASLAARLHREELEEQEQRKHDESAAMNTSLDGRAWLFVNQCLDLHKRLSKVAPGPMTVAVDDMVFLGKSFLQCIDEFVANGWPSQVTLAYHYTRSERMDTIQTDGLMTLADRKKTYNNSHGVGVFGDGIYTATNPFAFRHFGNTGLLVAVVLGNAARVPYTSNPKASLRGQHVNTVIGNKHMYSMNNASSNTISEGIKYCDELVLQESKQCLPLMRFETASVSTQVGKDAVWAFHEELQSLLDKVFNKGIRTQLTRIHESPSDPNAARAASGGASSTARLAPMIAAPPPAFISGAFPPPHLIGFSGQLPPQHLFRATSSSATAVAAAPTGSLSRSATLRPGPTAGISVASFSQCPTTHHWSKPELLKYTAPLTFMESTPSDVFVSCKNVSKEECVICMESLASSGRVVCLKACGHEYHKQCIKGALKAKPNCPVCRVMVRKPQGTCPSGTMEITTTSTRCSGFNCNSSIVITYTMPSGIQLPYHENPGQNYHGTTRVAYLPDNTEGRKLLKRLKFAWMHGLTFTIGTSLTTRQPNCITWASIHHKTSPSGGPHGFPDAGFFLNCNAELDAAGVPKE